VVKSARDALIGVRTRPTLSPPQVAWRFGIESAAFHNFHNRTCHRFCPYGLCSPSCHFPSDSSLSLPSCALAISAARYGILTPSPPLACS